MIHKPRLGWRIEDGKEKKGRQEENTKGLTQERKQIWGLDYKTKGLEDRRSQQGPLKTGKLWSGFWIYRRTSGKPLEGF